MKKKLFKGNLMNFRIPIFIALSLCFLSGCSTTPNKTAASPEPLISMNEILYSSIPKNYVLGYKALNSQMDLKEYVPKNESHENWTEMITVQTYIGMVHTSPKKFASLIKNMGKKVCPGIKSTVGEEGIQNGYRVYNWKQVCSLNPNTNRVEATLIKAIAGNENFYTVQKAWAYYPNEKETLTWQHNLRKILVCDTGIPERQCPHFKTGVSKVE